MSPATLRNDHSDDMVCSICGEEPEWNTDLCAKCGSCWDCMVPCETCNPLCVIEEE